MVNVIRTLSSQAVIEEMKSQDSYKGINKSMHWRQVIDFYSGLNGPPEEFPFVLIEGVPVNLISYEYEVNCKDEKKIVDYSQRETPPPPIFVQLLASRYQQFLLNSNFKPICVINGRHRVCAAILRGKTEIDAIMTQNAWNYLQRIIK